MSYNVAVVGATGAVGREMLQTLAERKFPAAKVYALASSNSAGREISYGEDDVIKVQSLDTFDFSSADIALFSAGVIPPKRLGQKPVMLAVLLLIIHLPFGWMIMCR